MLPIEKSCGVILILRKDGDEDRFLILKQNNKPQSWSFPKGHMEEGETTKETALRELYEEAGVTELEFTNFPNIIEEYDHNKDGEMRHKINELFIAFTKNDKVIPQESEVLEYKWATYGEAINTFTYEQPKNVLKKIKEYLENYGK